MIEKSAEFLIVKEVDYIKSNTGNRKVYFWLIGDTTWKVRSKSIATSFTFTQGKNKLIELRSSVKKQPWVSIYMIHSEDTISELINNLKWLKENEKLMEANYIYDKQLQILRGKQICSSTLI